MLNQSKSKVMSMRKKQLNPLKNSAGVTFIEVLVSALVLGIGVLGIMSLQGKSLQYSQQAYLYSQANFLAMDIAERISANRHVAADGGYEMDFGSTQSSSSDCATAECSAEDMATWDLAEWLERVQRILPGGDAKIQHRGASSDYLIVVKYEDDRDAEFVENQISLVVQP